MTRNKMLNKPSKELEINHFLVKSDLFLHGRALRGHGLSVASSRVFLRWSDMDAEPADE